MSELEKMGRGKLAVGLFMIDKLGHRDFAIKRHPSSKHNPQYFHEYTVVLNDNDAKWSMFTFENNKVEWRCGTIQ